MPDHIAVAAENISYEVSLIGDAVSRRAVGSKAVGGRLIRQGRHTKLLALDDLSFSAASGSRVGIVGRNGAGKSTLLRVIAGIQKPTAGRLAVNGKISTLFNNRLVTNPNITGLETILLSGLLMGLSRQEVQEITPEIVAFSELEDFIELPIRTYSAGMKTRLGFAVATSIKPDILLIDEVFGAGDREFQQKAAQRINGLMESASTLFLASQSMGIIERMCDHLLWLDHGKLRAFGRLEEIMPVFLEEGKKNAPAPAGKRVAAS
jgi:ABC-type polysaccharide/polyol phosphate transport system ATPase subunit